MTTTTSSTSSTSSTTSTATAATVASTSTTASTAASAQSILTALNAGSGIDITSLVSSLTSAQFAAQTSALQTKSDAVDKKISDIGTLLSNIKSFSSALDTLVTGGTLQTTPTVSNSSILTATGKTGAKLAGLSTTLQVQQLATAQSAASNVIDPTTTFGTGSLTLTLGSVTTNSDGTKSFNASGSGTQITIDSSHATLAGIASQINAAKTGVTASVVTDGSGARLVMRGATGAAQAFTLTASEDSDDGNAATGLSQFAFDPTTTSSTMTQGSTAQDAIVSLDGVQFHRSSNQINDLVTGVSLNLLSASPGTNVTLGSSTPTSALSQAVTDFVDTYNQFHTIIAGDLDAKTGSLTQDVATRSLNTQLQNLPLAKLITSTGTGAPTTLAEIGVETNQDGSLSVDSSKLSNAIANYPDAVEAMFTQTTDGTGLSLSNKLDAIANTASSYTVGLAQASTIYTAQKSTIATQQGKLTDQETAYQTRLTAQYTAMNSIVSSYKSVGSFLTNQIAAWNKTSN